MTDKRRQAEDFLRTRLAEQSVLLSELIAEAAGLGISRRTLYRAAERVGMISVPLPPGQKGVRWRLPGEYDERYVRWAKQQVEELVADGMRRDFAIWRACQENRVLAEQVEAAFEEEQQMREAIKSGRGREA